MSISTTGEFEQYGSSIMMGGEYNSICHSPYNLGSFFTGSLSYFSVFSVKQFEKRERMNVEGRERGQRAIEIEIGRAIDRKRVGEK